MCAVVNPYTVTFSSRSQICPHKSKITVIFNAQRHSGRHVLPNLPSCKGLESYASVLVDK